MSTSKLISKDVFKRSKYLKKDFLFFLSAIDINSMILNHHVERKANKKKEAVPRHSTNKLPSGHSTVVSQIFEDDSDQFVGFYGISTFYGLFHAKSCLRIYIKYI